MIEDGFGLDIMCFFVAKSYMILWLEICLFKYSDPGIGNLRLAVSRLNFSYFEELDSDHFKWKGPIPV